MSQHSPKNIQWYHAYKCWNTVLYSGLWLGRRERPLYPPPTLKLTSEMGEKRDVSLLHYFHHRLIKEMLFITFILVKAYTRLTETLEQNRATDDIIYNSPDFFSATVLKWTKLGWKQLLQMDCKFSYSHPRARVEMMKTTGGVSASCAAGQCDLHLCWQSCQELSSCIPAQCSAVHWHFITATRITVDLLFPLIVWQPCDIFTSQPQRCQRRHQNMSLVGKKKNKETRFKGGFGATLLGGKKLSLHAI